MLTSGANMYESYGLPMSRSVNRVAWLTHMELFIWWQIHMVEKKASLLNI